MSHEYDAELEFEDEQRKLRLLDLAKNRQAVRNAANLVAMDMAKMGMADLTECLRKRLCAYEYTQDRIRRLEADLADERKLAEEMKESIEDVESGRCEHVRQVILDPRGETRRAELLRAEGRPKTMIGGR